MRVAVAMSGGVDSSCAALRLKNEGHEVSGLTAWLWRCGSLGEAPRGSSMRPPDSACCGSVEGLKRARAAAEALGLEHHVVDLSSEFEEHVVAETARAYASGQTPNPCALCNSKVRFPNLLKAARELGLVGPDGALATGHYARLLPSSFSCRGAPPPPHPPANTADGICVHQVSTQSGGTRLLRGRDPDHDQSYFLFAVSPSDLAFARFPLGDMTKAEARASMAREGHPSAQTPSSQDLCFAGAMDVPSLVRSRSLGGLDPGDIVHVDGRVLGTHRGLARYTVGQRKGIGVAWTEPLYVVELRPETNELVVGPDRALLRTGFSVEGVTWLAPGMDAKEALECDLQIRYRMKAVPARVNIEGGGRARVELSAPVRAVAPGQAAVFYARTPDGDEVLGGGWIGRPGRVDDVVQTTRG